MLRRLIDNLTFSKSQWGPIPPPSPAWFLPLPRELEYCLLENRVVGSGMRGRFFFFFFTSAGGGVFMGEKNLGSKTGLAGTMTEL